jgi:hypothetical protein
MLLCNMGMSFAAVTLFFGGRWIDAPFGLLYGFLVQGVVSYSFVGTLHVSNLKTGCRVCYVKDIVV